MIWPELVLLRGALRGDGGSARKLAQREILVFEGDLPGGDVLLEDHWLDGGGEVEAVGAAEVFVSEDRDFGVGGAEAFPFRRFLRYQRLVDLLPEFAFGSGRPFHARGSGSCFRGVVVATASSE